MSASLEKSFSGFNTWPSDMTDTGMWYYARKASGLRSATVARGADGKVVDSIGEVCALCIVEIAFRRELNRRDGSLEEIRRTAVTSSSVVMLKFTSSPIREAA